MKQEDRVHDLIYICQRLNEILAIENKALENNKPKDMKGTLEEKDKLCRLYEHHVRAISSKPDEFNQIDEDLRKELKELSEEVDELIALNARLLKMNLEVNRRVLTSFANAAKKATQHPGTYNNDAKNGTCEENITPLSLNETL